MPREKEGYREQLEDILSFFGGKRILSQAEVVRYTGLYKRTVLRRYGIGAEGISAVQLARKLI